MHVMKYVHYICIILHIGSYSGEESASRRESNE